MDEEPAVSPMVRLNQIAQFARPRTWIMLIAVVTLLFGVLAWAALARAPKTVLATGIISTQGGPVNIGTSLDGTVTDVYVGVGETVQAGNTIAVVKDDAGRSLRVLSPVTGVISEISTQVGDFVNVGDTVGTLQNNGEAVEAIALMPVSTVGDVKVGQLARIAPDSVPVGDFGYLTGTVISVGATPMSDARVKQLEGSISGFDSSTDIGEPVVEVRIGLNADPANPSGFDWTVGTGPPFAPLAGTPWNGSVVLGSTTPLSTLLGI